MLGKAGEELCLRSMEYLRQHCPEVDVHLGQRGEPYPLENDPGRFDYVISYLSPWIVKKEHLARANIAAINFHPGPPEYPGIGCTNFAIYNRENTFGVTCHHMAPQVDSGAIIRVVRFPLYETDSVLSLTQRCYAHIAVLFYEVLDDILAGRLLPQSSESWRRKPYRRSQLEELCRLTKDMSEEEVALRKRATAYPGYPGARYVDR